MQRPKRKYTISPKVLAANRANLLKANAVPKAIRYRPTDRRLAACRANLLKANAVPKAIRYQPTARRLAACRANLLKAQAVLKAAGEDSPAYGSCFRHGLYCLSLRRSLGLAGERGEEYEGHLSLFDRAFAPQDEEEKKLVRGMGETAWRRLRAWRGQAHWERRSLEYRLAEAARGPALSAESALDLAVEVLGIFFNHDESLKRALGQLNRRLERLSRLLLGKRCGRDPDFEFLAHPEPREVLLAGQPDAALHNPFLSPREVARRVEEKPLALPELRGWGGGKKPNLGDLFSDPGAGKALRYGLMRRWLRESRKSGAPSAEDFAAHLELFERVFLRPEAELHLNPDEDDKKLMRRVAVSILTSRRFLSEQAELKKLVRRLAEVAWERLGTFRRQAEQEARLLKQLLEHACRVEPSPGPPQNSQGTPDPQVMTAARTRDLAAQVLAVFWDDQPVLDAACQLQEQLEGAFYQLLRKRWGRNPKFECLRRQPERDETDFTLLDLLLDPHLGQGLEAAEKIVEGKEGDLPPPEGQPHRRARRRH